MPIDPITLPRTACYCPRASASAVARAAARYALATSLASCLPMSMPLMEVLESDSAPM